MTTDELKALLAETTPAPWNWRLEDGPEWFLSPGVLKVEGGMTDGTPMGDAIDRANARLIALAPDLAAALIKAREGLEGIERTYYTEGKDAVWRSVHMRAISSATLAEIDALMGGKDD